MQEKRTSLFFLETLIIVIVFGFLSAIAIPHVGQMVNKSRGVSREAEFNHIQTAVTEMLYDSTAGKLESVGPTADMSLVHTCDTPPLVLKDYLPDKNESSIKSGCAYGFAADGTVLQIMP
jgi:Tfp pilus assembly protein PilE